MTLDVRSLVIVLSGLTRRCWSWVQRRMRFLALSGLPTFILTSRPAMIVQPFLYHMFLMLPPLSHLLRLAGLFPCKDPCDYTGPTGITQDSLSTSDPKINLICQVPFAM